MKIKHLIMIFLLSSISMMAQVTGLTEQSLLLKQGLDANKSMSTDLFESEQMPVSNVVDPDNYYVGPGDVLMVKAIPMITESTPVIVSPDNMLMLPRSGGMVNVNGKTLTEVRQLIEDSFTKYKADAIVTVAFQKPHICLIEVEGNVINSNTLSIPSTFKVSDAINYANKREPLTKKSLSTEDTYIQEKIRIRKSFSRNQDHGEIAQYWQRNILVIHEDGTSSLVDLIKSKTAGNANLDPYVKQGDKIIVPFNKGNYSTIAISGEVIRPITIPYKVGDKLSELIKYSMGLTSEADINNIYLYEGAEKTKLSASNGKIQVNNDRELKAGAVVIVGKIEKSITANSGAVTVRGFVNEPGSYPITNSKTTLSEVIDMAGGIKEGAYLPNAKVYRHTNEFDFLSDSRTEAFKLFRKSNLSLEDTVRYTLDVKAIEPIVSVDFTKALNDSKYDITLENGDQIVIPSSPNQVYVFGRIENPGFVEFKKGANVEYYIKEAGGFTDVADDGRTAVIRNGTDEWVNNLEAVVYDGDYIYVPGEVDVSTSTQQAKVSTYAAIASIILSIGFLIVNIVNLNNK